MAIHSALDIMPPPQMSACLKCLDASKCLDAHMPCHAYACAVSLCQRIGNVRKDICVCVSVKTSFVLRLVSGRHIIGG